MRELFGRLRWGLTPAVLASLVMIGSVCLPAATARSVRSVRSVRAHAAYAQQCPDPYPSTRDPSNPLMLPNPPGADPLTGANFFVDGPKHGSAAGAIARLLGIDTSTPLGSALPSFSDDDSWAAFRDRVERRIASGRVDPGVVRQIRLLEKIADQPEAQRFSSYAQGGGPGAIYSQVQKIFCHNMQADPGSIPVITTYFMHADYGGCSSNSQLAAGWPTTKRRIDEMAAATGNRPAVYLLELDAFGSSSCMARIGSLGTWERYLRYEVDKISALPHTVVYLEAGYSDSNSVGYTARALNAAGVRNIRGFFTNDTHINWTIDEVHWAEAISRLTGGAHYIVNTAQNGNGPKKNPHPTTQGNEDLCNPPGRGLGPRDTTDTGFPHADAFLWTHTPGNSSGHCHGGPDPGAFWAARAIDLAAHANSRLGPGFASDPY
jgi:Glycosyl hydrolases family 6